jgi:hypothetical protein
MSLSIVIFRSSTYPNKVLTVREVPLLFLEDYDPADPHRNQTWQMDGDYGSFRMVGGTGDYLRYGGVPWTTFDFVRAGGGPPPEGNSVFFSLGDPPEEWGDRALRPNSDTGQNFDAGIDSPNPSPLGTRGWRDGHQRELTWKVQKL